MKLFFDTEFTGLHKNTTLLSIGIVDEYGDCFYAEFTDYDPKQVDEWIHDNVIMNMEHFGDRHGRQDLYNPKFRKTTCLGDKQFVREHLLKWLNRRYNEVEFVSDVCHYDFVLLIDLLADSALDLPEYINASCHDINQDIAKYYNVTEKDAFNMTREDIIDASEIFGEKHNALFDAKVIKAIYEKIHE